MRITHYHHNNHNIKYYQQCQTNTGKNRQCIHLCMDIYTILWI